jgi:hypothetical protein
MLTNTEQACFIDREDDVLREMRAFWLNNMMPRTSLDEHVEGMFSIETRHGMAAGFA